MVNRYSFGIHEQLEPQELFFLVFVDTAAKHFGVEDIAALGAVVAGYPLLPTRTKFNGATRGTSIASVVARKALPFKLKYQILPTVTLKSMASLKILFVRNIGAFVGRTIPVIGVFMLAYDAYRISTESVRAYNALVKEEDRMF
ncbi:STM2901 family protein [Paracidovorax valerianellae]|uniref:Uncharacterized protein n=1 Tax=Paracidovorax valerianellae TaxID=187868 RepID=A0A1G7AXG1_9BURK|nr:hypothetical protein [Paracidovorax valerianellae]MDA8445636.1 hypothetical protein [Paracidovorax valerianellae]SDE19402.1 hypothetical protein SAMN05192589_11393 [Paracidovorax valerianellae]